ncbi:MAG: ABC transporter substrate-binding protein [Bryobacteraceae bacterium]|nr:ABC transporter substrate-binding protein [Bryobacteraceae bacterium]
MSPVSRPMLRREWLGFAAGMPFARRAVADPGSGVLRVAVRADVRSFQPLTALDDPTRTALALCHAGLVRTNGVTLQPEPYLAERVTVSRDGKRISATLRAGLRFSDGAPLTVDDVVFTFAAHLDPKSGSPQRDSLIFGGEPLRVEKRGPRDLEFVLNQPFALGARILDGVAILPRHRLEAAFRDGKLNESWGLGTPLGELAGAGPYRIAEHKAGIGLFYAPNPHYFRPKSPQIGALSLLFSAGEDAQVARFAAGEADLVSGFGAGNYGVIEGYAERRGLRLYDLGASLDYSFVLFNLGKPDAAPPIAVRRAMARAIDRSAIAKLVYRGLAAPLVGHVTPGRGEWMNRNLARAFESAESPPPPKRFTLLVNSGNPAHMQTASIIEADCAKAGIPVAVVALEFRSLVDRVVNRRDFEAAILSLRSGDLDPVADMNVMLSSGQSHLWNPRQATPATAWEAEIDGLMRSVATTLDRPARKKAFDRVQAILAEQVPWIPLVSPHTLFAARRDLGGLRPSLVGHPALWNVEELHWLRTTGR